LFEQLTHEEIKKHIKARLGIVPDDATLDLCPPMHPDHGFIEMVSALLLLVPLDFFLLPDPGLGRLQGNLCLVPEINPPLLEDATLRAWNQAHAKEVKKKKDEEKKKRIDKAKRKEEREKHRRRQCAVGEDEEESSDDENDDEERSHDWLDALTEEDDELVVEHTP
jgi:hypothetical protein